MKVIFNRKYHLGKWYEAESEGDLPYNLAVRMINKGIVHPAPKPKRKKKVASKNIKEKKPASKKVYGGSDSGYTDKRSEKVDRVSDSRADSKPKDQ